MSESAEFIIGIFIGIGICICIYIYYKYFHFDGSKFVQDGINKMNQYYGIRYRQEAEKGKIPDYILNEDIGQDPYDPKFQE